jgi:ubiquinone/menaquinone biosynthesis C-methylase UbiE
MNTQSQEISQQQRESWNNFAPGWRKWDALTMEFLKPYADEIIRQVEPQSGDMVLDIASGTGEPGITIAKMIGIGKVIITDLSEGMLEVAMDNAERQGLTNVEAGICDVSALPFEDETFDVVTCRFGFMFFPDMDKAASEIVRVLKPGGRFSTSVWGPPADNFWVTSIMDTIKKYVEVPLPVPGAPSMFRCAEKGLMSGILRGAGINVTDDRGVWSKIHPGTAETYWNFMTDIGAPIVAALSKTSSDSKESIREEVIDLIDERYPGETALDTYSFVIGGNKL